MGRSIGFLVEWVSWMVAVVPTVLVFRKSQWGVDWNEKRPAVAGLFSSLLAQEIIEWGYNQKVWK